MLRTINLHQAPKHHIAVYTDASIRKQKLGLGIYSKYQQTSAFFLERRRHYDIHFGEMAAILYSIKTTPCFAPLVIYTDSDAAIHHVASHCSKYSMLRNEIRNTISHQHNDVWLTKIKGHSNIYGNDAAHKLAFTGADLHDGMLFELMHNVLIKTHHKKQHT